ncbi:DUF5988 family protein [Streptacidiphilus sp. P02-A3a]|uniref:DUF5988 family protein n=1 Tax=Streptacidiphilus sp. P02-A3a TaxID=2704468 RepID=UPI0015FCB11C|nr:DUF5988 family protein [Streptacidiphilus sp. P02-A3a]QMU71576.1 hypothetical protein GXP74_28415 [Streptacidiphilus sp. P02-A3a]
MSLDPNVVLRGGPSSLSDDLRIRYLPNTEVKFKILRGNRYEHFEPTEQTTVHDDRELQVFVWTGCTYVAE